MAAGRVDGFIILSNEEFLLIKRGVSWDDRRNPTAGAPAAGFQYKLGAWMVLLQLVLDLAERRHRAFLVEVAARRAAHTDPANGRAVRFDGHAADCVGDVWQRRLRDR